MACFGAPAMGNSSPRFVLIICYLTTIVLRNFSEFIRSQALSKNLQTVYLSANSFNLARQSKCAAMLHQIDASPAQTANEYNSFSPSTL
jgi:hypothetical protein